MKSLLTIESLSTNDLFVFFFCKFENNVINGTCALCNPFVLCTHKWSKYNLVLLEVIVANLSL